MSNKESDDECEEGGLFGSIGFMFDTAREKIIRDFKIKLPIAQHETESGEKGERGEMEIEISLNMIDDDPGHVQSGQYLWPAAYSLSRYLMQHWNSIVCSMGNRLPVVIELGSGVGMCGQFLGKYFSDIEKRQRNCSSITSVILPPHIVLTDYDPGCLAMLEENIELNSLQKRCQVARVEWGNDLSDLYKIINCFEDKVNGNENKTPILVIGSDLLYCVSVVKPLFRTVHSMLTSLSSESCKQDPISNTTIIQNGQFILASSFDIGQDVQSEVDRCCEEYGIVQSEVQKLDLATACPTNQQYRIQRFSIQL